MSIYEERPEEPKPIKEDVVKLPSESPYLRLSDILATQLEFEDSVLYLNDEITEHTLVDLMIRIRRLLDYRTSEKCRRDTRNGY